MEWTTTFNLVFVLVMLTMKRWWRQQKIIETSKRNIRGNTNGK